MEMERNTQVKKSLKLMRKDLQKHEYQTMRITGIKPGHLLNYHVNDCFNPGEHDENHTDHDEVEIDFNEQFIIS